MGRGASDDMDFTPRPRGELRSLRMLYEEFDEIGAAKGVGAEMVDKFTAIRSLPVPVASEAGEELDVYGRKVSYEKTRLTWEFKIVGHDTGHEYATVTSHLDGEDVVDIDMDFYTLALKMVLHHPADLDDSVYEAWCALTDSEAAMHCSICDRGFVTWQQAADHEAKIHGIDPTDRRPRIPRGRSSA